MSLSKKEVFLASRFQEFAELRARLRAKISTHRASPLSVIDLNDGAVTSRPPLEECLRHVRRSEFMILLLGDSYGALAPHQEKSFTHLEYDEAIRDGSTTRVLVFAVGECYRGGRMRHADDARLAAWQRQVEENHTVGYFDPEVSVDEIAQAIHEQLFYALLEMSAGSSQAMLSEDLPEDVLDGIDEDSLLDEGEVKQLDARYGIAEAADEQAAAATDVLGALSRPAAMAAQEQRLEALRALELDQYPVAVRHLERALDLKPLEWSSNYWLAQLYVASGLRHKAREAVKLAERAARLAETEGRAYSQAAALVIGARAARLAGDAEYALQLAGRARETANYSLAFLEYARQLLLEGRDGAAMAEIRTAFHFRPQSLKEVFTDPVFRPIRQDVAALYQDRKARMARDLGDLARHEAVIAELAGGRAEVLDTNGRSIRQLVDLGRQSIRRQYAWVCQLLRDADARMREWEQPDGDPAAAAQRVSLSFQYPGSATIVHWNKEPGDVIEPGETVFSYRYQRSATDKAWVLRGRDAVRLIERAGPDGHVVSAEQAFVFSHLPADVDPSDGRVSSLRKSVVEHAAAEGLERARLDELRAQQTQWAQRRADVDTDPSDSTLLPLGMLAGALLLLAATAHLAGLSAAAGELCAGLGIACLAWVLRRRARLLKSRAQTQAQRRALDARLAELAAQHTAVETAAGNEHEALVRASAELQEIEHACGATREAALRALRLFETASLQMAAMHPFARPQRAREGDVMRLSDNGLERLERGRRVEIHDDLPDWLGEAQETRKGARLFQVVEASSERVVLSRRLAFGL